MDASTQTEPVVLFPDYCEPDDASSRVSTILEVSEESSDDNTCHTEGCTQCSASIMSDSESTLLQGELDDPADGETLKTVDTPPTANTAASSQFANMPEVDGLPQSYTNASGILQKVIAEARSKNSISTMLKLLEADETVTVSIATSKESGKWEVHAMIKDTRLVEEIDRSTAKKISTMINRANKALAHKAKIGDLSTDIHPAECSGPMIVLTDLPQGITGLRCDSGRSVQAESTTPTTPSSLTADDALSRPATPAGRSGASTPTSPGSPVEKLKDKMSRLSAASMSASPSRALSLLRGRSPTPLGQAVHDATKVAASVGNPAASTATNSPERDRDRRNSYQGLLRRSRRLSTT